MWRMPRFALRVALALSLAFASATDAHAQAWPFGDAQRGGDFWNLGPLGAKAHTGIAARPEADASGKVSVSGDVAFLDGGQKELVLAVVAPGGPAALAGLAPGDVIVGVGGKKFTEDESLAALAKALVKARATRTIELMVERDGKSSRADVALLELGLAAKVPPDLEARAAAAAAARAFLAERQQADGSFPAGLAGDIGRVVNTSLAGLAFLAGGSDLEQGDRKDELTRALEFVLGDLEQRAGVPLNQPKIGEPNWDQSNWALVYAALFLGELYARTPNDRMKDALTYLAADLARRQESSGGYAHGPGGPNALDYVELNIVGAMALMAFGACERSGVPVDDDAVEKLIEYLDASASAGGVGYSTGEGQQGIGNIGRTVPTWLGLALLGEDKSGFAKATKSYAKSNATAFRDGHASLMQHFFFGALGARALSPKDGQKWFAELEREVVLAQAHDGSFQPRPFQETANLGSNGDVTMGEIWTTASWAVMLALDVEGGGLPLLLNAK
jgi:hypothetical protein